VQSIRGDAKFNSHSLPDVRPATRTRRPDIAVAYERQIGQSSRVSQTASKDCVPLSQVLSNDYGLSASDASVQLVSSARYFWSRFRLYGPSLILGFLGMAAILVRSAGRDRLGGTIAVIAVVSPFLLAYTIREVRRTVISEDSQLCIVSLPTEAINFLGVSSSHVRQDFGGRIPRYPLLAGQQGMVLGRPQRHGTAIESIALRDVRVRVELRATARGRLACCDFVRDEQSVRLSVRGRLRLNM
jgi:hypothetical protein